MDIETVIRASVESIFHPELLNRNSWIQNAMIQQLKSWLASHSNENLKEVITRLEERAVRRHENIRFRGQEEDKWEWNKSGTRITNVYGEGLSGLFASSLTSMILSTPLIENPVYRLAEHRPQAERQVHHWHRKPVDDTVRHWFVPEMAHQV